MIISNPIHIKKLWKTTYNNLENNEILKIYSKLKIQTIIIGADQVYYFRINDKEHFMKVKTGIFTKFTKIE